MQKGKEPQRMCIVCREMKPKHDLIRIVKTADNIVVNASNKVNGRGMYVCKNEECITNCCKKKSINKALSCNVEDSVYNTLKESLNSAK